MKQRKIESVDDFEMAMSAVQSSIQLLDMFDWDAWLELEAMFQSAGSVLYPEMYKAIQNDPQWDMKVNVIRAAATYMKTIHNIRAPLEKPNEE